MNKNKSVYRMIALLLSLILCVSCGVTAVNAIEASDVIEPELLDKIAADPNASIQIFVERKANPLTVEDMPSYDSADRESLYTARKELAAVNREKNQEFIKELGKYASFTVDGITNSTIVVLTIKARDIYRLAESESVFTIESMPEGKWINESEDTAEICIVYGYSMTADQQKEYNDADWSEKIGMLEKLYEQSKIDLMDGIGAICEYQVLCDTSINRIYLRVPAAAVENIKQVQYVRSVSYRTLSESKLNDGAQKLVAESDPGKIVSVLVWTDRGDVVCIRDFLNMTKQEFNTIRVIEDENGVTAHRKINHAYYNAFNQRLVSEITAETNAVYKPYITYHPEDDTYSEVEADMFLRFDIAVGQLEALSRIDGVTGITYEAPAQPDPYQDWYYLGGDQDLLHKLLGEPNEMGAYYIPQGMSIAFGKADEEEYSRFKEIDYVKGVKYCRPAPSDGWWKLEGDENLLKATYGEPNEDGRYYVPKKKAVKGDVDYDYSLTVVDATGIQRELAELSAEHFNAGAADYDDDGYMSVLDATAIQRTLAE